MAPGLYTGFENRSFSTISLGPSSGSEAMTDKAKEKESRRLAANPGAKEARNVLRKFQECMNSKHLVPEQCYRPSTSVFGVVMWINQVTALMISRNYFPVPSFINRAYQLMNQLPAERVSEPYRKVALSYLAHVAHYLQTYECFGEDASEYLARIPPELLSLGPQETPSEVLFPNEF